MGPLHIWWKPYFLSLFLCFCFISFTALFSIPLYLQKLVAFLLWLKWICSIVYRRQTSILQEAPLWLSDIYWIRFSEFLLLYIFNNTTGMPLVPADLLEKVFFISFAVISRTFATTGMYFCFNTFIRTLSSLSSDYLYVKVKEIPIVLF